ncbi:MAG: PilN domain-containing protein [Candidatus Binatia bacterium]
MIRINLLPFKQLAAEVSRRREITIGAVVLGVALTALGAVHLLQAYQLSGLEAELAQLRGELQALNTKIKEIGDLQNKIKEARGKNKIIDDLKKKKSGPVLVMENLANATPSTLWLTDLKESGGNLALSGLAADNKTVADFISGLEASKHFKSVELIETTEGAGPTAGFKKFAIKTGVLYQAPEAAPAETKTTPAAKKEEKKG